MNIKQGMCNGIAAIGVAAMIALAGCASSSGAANGAAAVPGAAAPPVTAAQPVSSGMMEMMAIPGGSFTMGTPQNEAGREDDEIQHPVTVSGFLMGTYQVTQEQYEAVMGNNPSKFTGDAAEGEVQEKRPVERVSWYDAIVFCNTLSMREGLTPVYTISGSTDPAVWGEVPASSNSTWNAVKMDRSVNGYRLPTEAEWEYACRAGTTTAFNTGKTMTDNTGWYDANSGEKTHEVGKKPANAWGLYDMHGNVQEWCWDLYGSYRLGARYQTDPEGVSSSSDGRRVLNGGGYLYSPDIARSGGRNHWDPFTRLETGGFRVARSSL